MSAASAPAWVPVVLSVRQASRVLKVSGRTLRSWLKGGVISGHHFDTDYPWTIPTSEVERVATALHRTPDWRALANNANHANPQMTPRVEAG